ncbi:FG-GAP repeat protein [Streptomyces bingchenggensis BCW-1]|uniref:FG-GAP repeat protein n=1 Tax=Streptomyces bingchenggensis (strain BCW-1) TaxID=749414 RepID=D7BUF3_STRBB|nr:MULTISPECIES: rhamnogalacturonan lyase [Streptomyces]ADI11702.1 FG-GAP repeat protein [Streptomyces bingchenggensis BCW-1]
MAALSLTALLMCAGLPTAQAAPPAQAASSGRSGHIQLEELNRGLVAARTSDGVFLTWRLLADEVTGGSKAGQTGADFHVYRDGKRIATVTDSTDYVDQDASAGASYRVAAVVAGHETNLSDAVTPWDHDYYDLPLKKPAGGVTPAGEQYTYTASDVSVGDTDGDGAYEYVVKWDPSNSKDNSQRGYTGSVLIDTYRLDGTLLNRVDLGPNIRAGAHYTQFLVYDFDGDGRSEMMFKTAPGTKTIRYNSDGSIKSQRYITLPQADRKAGYTSTDDYRLSKDGYYQHLVDLFRNWQNQKEVKSGQWPATLEKCFGIDARYSYPLSEQDAKSLADYFMDVYAPARSTKNALRDFEGFILDGPEYLSVFDGTTGTELQTVHYEPGRTDDGLRWGDYAMARIEPGNRVDRFLSTVAYLDGSHPSAVFARGYYTRTAVAAYTWDGKRLHKQWYADSGWGQMTNPFNDDPHSKDGSNPKYAALTDQGFHSMTSADVDGDGRQEIVYGSATLDDDGSLLYSSYGTLPEGSNAPGKSARLGHGDRIHVTDIDPDRPGLEIYTVHENAKNAPYGVAMRDAATGKVLFGAYSGLDTEQAMVGDIDPDTRGLENWSSMPEGTSQHGLFSATGKQLSTTTPVLSERSIRFTPDMTTQMINNFKKQPELYDFQRGTILKTTGTMGPISLVADLFGDYREEMAVPTTDSSALRIYTNTQDSDHKLFTLMQDPQYRVEVARQQTAYNQASYPGYYFASDTDFAKVPVPSHWTPGGIAALQNQLKGLIDRAAVTGTFFARTLTQDLARAQAHLTRGNRQEAAREVDRFATDLHKQHGGSATQAAASALGYQARTLSVQLR